MPLTAIRPGTKTRDAKQRLDGAEASLNGLDVAEPAWKEARQPAERQAKFIESASAGCSPGAISLLSIARCLRRRAPSTTRYEC